MNCRDAVIRLHAYLGRALNAVEIQEVEHHLKACPSCEDHFEFEGVVLYHVRTKAREECCPDGLKQRLLNAIRAGSH